MFRFRSQSSLVALVTVGLLALCGSAWSVAGYRPSSRNPRPSNPGRLRVGIDVLEEQNFAPLLGKNVGLVTNQTGVDWLGRRTIDVLARAPNVKLIALFSPEHGIGAAANTSVADSTDPATGLRIYSLYGATRRPTDEMLRNIDVLVFDIQDAGVRFYTYITTMAYCLEAAKQFGISFMVLDRPNPLGGDVIEGPMLDPARKSFTGYFPMPVRYGMTLGELAEMFNAEDKIGADLHVFSMMNWHRGQTYDQTRLAWIPPSPNLRTVDAAFLYPGVEILQAGGVSVGRGTDAPFEIIGAPWIRADEFATALESRKIPGVRFRAAQFTPTDGLYSGQTCQGVSIAISNRAELQSMRMGLEIADALHRMYPDRFQLDKIVELLGSQSTVDRLKRGDAPADIVAGWSADLDKFRAMREKYLLYH
jgi:uncharacterized protein YbbC (DUF1343 family)